MIAILAMIHLKYRELKANKDSYLIQAEEIMKLINDIKYNR